MREISITNYIEKNCEGDEDIYRTFTTEKLESTISAIKDELETARSIAEESGILDLINEHESKILESMKLEYLPKEDLEL